MRKIGRFLKTAPMILFSMVLVLVAGTTAAADPPVLHLSGTYPGGTSILTLDLATGANTWVAFVALAGGGAANIYAGGLAYDPYADRLYATGTDAASVSKFYRVDPATGVATEIGPTGEAHWLASGGLAFDLQTGILYATGQENDPYHPTQGTFLYTVDTSTGAATPIGYTGTPGTYLYGLGFDPVSGALYAQGFRNFDQRSALFIVDRATGAATFIGENGVYIGRGLNYGSLAFHPVTHVLYAQGSLSASLNGLYTVNPATGAATFIGPFSGGTGADGGLTFIGSYASGIPPAPEATPRLYRNHPNPFNPRTAIRFYLPKVTAVRVAVFGLDGRLVRELVDGERPAGINRTDWDGRDADGRVVSSGTYVCRLAAGAYSETRKMTLLR